MPFNKFFVHNVSLKLQYTQLTCISSTQFRRSWINLMLTSSSVILGSATDDFRNGLLICVGFKWRRLLGFFPPLLSMSVWAEGGCKTEFIEGLKHGMRHGVRLEVNVDPVVPNPPGVRAGGRLVFGKPEFRLCVMPEIIILVCSVVRVRPLLYKEEQSTLRAKRSSRSFDTLASKKKKKHWVTLSDGCIY